jgi:DNA repair protein RadD
MIELRDYQAELVTLSRLELTKGKKRVLVVLPTGGGKTYVMADIAQRATEKGHRVLCLMHRRQLVGQMKDRFADYGLEVGIVMAGYDSDLLKPIQIGTIQTYQRRIRMDDAGYRPFFVDAAVVMVDEAHRSLSKTFQKTLALYDKSVVVGVTATPCLASGVGMGRYYDALVAPTGVGDLIDAGYLVPARYFAPTTPDLDGIRTVQGDYEKKALGERMNTTQLVGDVFENWARIAGGKQTIVFAVNVKHSKALCREFERNGVSAAHLDAYSSEDKRSQVLTALFDKRLQVVFNVGLYTEGFDYPAAECIVLARPTKSRGLYLQMAGRGLRPYDGKSECIIIDHGNNVERLGFIDEPVVWTLDGKKLAWAGSPQRKAEKTPMTCEMCSFVFTGARCPNCGHEVPHYGKRIAAIEAELKELRRTDKKHPTIEDKMRWYGMLEYHRRLKGYSTGWTAHTYRKRFGVWPKFNIDVEPIRPDLEVNNYIRYLIIQYAKRKKAEQYRVQDPYAA